VKGLYINLERCSQRRDALLAGLDAAGLNAAAYERFPALEPVGAEPQLTRGLKTKGELGIWMSLVEALKGVASRDYEPVVHMLEDDMAFAPMAGPVITKVAHMLVNEPSFAEIDVIFLDYFMDRKLFASIASASERLGGNAYEFLPADAHYYACLGSWLIKKSSAAYLSGILERILATANRLIPVDLALRTLLQIGALKGLLLVPPVCAPSWESDDHTTIQLDLKDGLRSSQRAHLLFRLLASGLQSPRWCADRLSALYGIDHGLDDDSPVDAYLALHDSIASRLATF
jgi:GR25 family glycosyltransferase involved in LPS biosynthesis